MRVLAGIVLPLLAAAAAGQGEEPVPVPVARYLEARKLLYEDDLPSAVELFERVVREHPGSDVADDALYWAAWARARTPDGEPRAVEAWLRLLERYPASPWVDEAAAALRTRAREEAAARLRRVLETDPPEDVVRRVTDARAALGDEAVLPALEARLGGGDGEAALGLSRLGAAGEAALGATLLDATRSPAARTAALEGWSRALLVEKTVPADRAERVLREIEKDPALLPVRRRVRALLEALREPVEESLAETVRRLRREVADLRAQVAELEKLLER